MRTDTAIAASPRVALFTDSYHEANGVARTTTALEVYAAARSLPLLMVHAGPETGIVHDRSITRIELQRGVASFGLEHDLRFDLLLWRHLAMVRRQLRQFAPDVIHFTGPSDVGQLGAYLGHTLGVPMVGSWHTNLHEYASRRLRLRWVPARVRAAARTWAEARTLWLEGLFYKIPRVILAPNDDLLTLLRERTGKPGYRMSRGVDTTAFSPERRTRPAADGFVNIGYVGRLSPEKSVRVLADLYERLQRAGASGVRFTVVGDGSDRAWLESHLPRATFTGVLRGAALSEAYANMDLFVFPSETETVGNVVLEALASGVPVVTMASGGPRFVAGGSSACVFADTHAELLGSALRIVEDRAQRQRMRDAARTHALGRSWDGIFDGVYSAYAMALALAAHTSVAEPAVAVSEHGPAL